MFHAPDHFRTVSLKLSEVLSDVGVNKRMVKKRRRMVMMTETLKTITERLAGNPLTLHHYGSRSEGSTTLGLASDLDTLFCDNRYNMIQDWNEWQPGMADLLTIQDETTSPGHCMLQMLSPYQASPLPAVLISDNMSGLVTVSGDRVLLKNTINKGFNAYTINGPAASSQGKPGFGDEDFVFAFHCKSWPEEAHHWLIRQGLGKWPSNYLKGYSESTGFFVVPVSSKSGRNQETEWRISTSAAERCLMFSLNMTQLRCYVLMKMVVKTFINPRCNGEISSFICKTVLFHVIQSTRPCNWRKSNLLVCLICCLTVLHKFVAQENCPHFIIPENNLLARRMSPLNKLRILESLQFVIESEGRVILDIPYDKVGTRLQVKMNGMNEAVQFCKSPAQIHAETASYLLKNVTNVLSGGHKTIFEQLALSPIAIVLAKISEYVSKTKSYTDMASNSLEDAFKHLLPFMLTSIGSVKASGEIYTTQHISLESLTWLSAGLNSDVSSGRLKLASVFYCSGDMERAEFVLSNTEEKYDLNTVEPVCGCHDFRTNAPYREGFVYECINGHEKLIQQVTAFCVRFLRCEAYCVPKELHYEMFRSTQEDMLEKGEDEDHWMDMAVVDALPYLYFLQFKTYDVLGRFEEKQRALVKLFRTINTEPNLGHMETALNLLGQCMEQEHRHNDALRCYMKSLTIRPRNNAANFHIPRLLHYIANR